MDQELEQFNAQLQRKTGIDFQAYRDAQLIETLTDLIAFPIYAIRTIIWPLGCLAGLALFAAFWFVAAGDWWLAALFGLIGFPMAAVNGVFLGLVALSQRIRDDLSRIINLSFKLSQRAFDDIKTVQQRATDATLELPSASEVVRGIVLIVVLPGTGMILKRKLPFVGTGIYWVVRRAASACVAWLVPQIDTEEEEKHRALASDPAASQEERLSEIGAYCDNAVNILEQCKGLLVAFVPRAIWFAALPLTGIAGFVALVSASIFGLLYWLVA